MSKHKPAFPGIELNGNGSPYQSFFGLTKREFFALNLLTGLISNTTINSKVNNKDLAMITIKLADDLLEALDLTK